MSALAILCAHSIVLMKERFFIDSGEMCSVIVILALVLEQERLDNRPQHLIHVPLTDQSPDLSPSVSDVSNIVIYLMSVYFRNLTCFNR